MYGCYSQTIKKKISLATTLIFSKKISPALQKYSSYDHEVTAIYEAIKYFYYLLEACDFYICTDHKPITFAFVQKSKKDSPRQQRQLEYISHFFTNIVHISGSDDMVADSLLESMQLYYIQSLLWQNWQKNKKLTYSYKLY